MKKATQDVNDDNDGGSSRKGRYRKVEVRTWADAKFRALSPIPPCGQGLWLFLITGPHTGPIPGLFRAGRYAMAEELGWEVEAFDKAFGEALGQGMLEADFQQRVIWIPRAISYNKPESPNVVRSWGAEFDLIPECDLKWKALEALKASIHALGEPYGKAFDETFRKASGKPSPKTCPNQEQEQELNTNTPLPPQGGKRAGGSRRTAEEETADMAMFEHRFWPAYPKKADKRAAYRAWRRLRVTPDLLERMLAGLELWKRHHKWTKDGGQYRHNASTWLNGRFWEDEEVCGKATTASAKPAWMLAAGFANLLEAENAGCFEHTASQFRDGVRLREPA